MIERRLFLLSLGLLPLVRVTPGLARIEEERRDGDPTWAIRSPLASNVVAVLLS